MNSATLDRSALLDSLAEVVGAGHVLSDAGLRAPYEKDYTGRYGGEALAVVRPANTEEVSAVVAVCAQHGAAVVPQGGNTGVVGGGVPRRGEVVVSLRRLDQVGAVAADTGHVLVGAGATLESVQEAARDAGWELPLDLGARDAATIGGVVATDAGGAMALAHGTMRRRVAGLEVVLPDGQVVQRLGGLHKDNAGYAWPSIFVGSEGTLGILTAVLVQLIPRRTSRVAAMFAVDGPADALQLLIVLRRMVASLESADFFFDEGVDLVDEVLDGVRLPLQRRAGCYVVVECASLSDPLEELAEAVEAAGAIVLDQAAADDTAGRHAIWRLREALPEAVVRNGVPLKIDVAVPLSAVGRFSTEVTAVVERIAPQARTILWGHVGDGNVHVNVLQAENATGAVEAAVLELAAALGGTISAEHGVGISKPEHLGLVRTPAEIALLRSMKDAIDPRGIMNPGVVFPAST